MLILPIIIEASLPPVGTFHGFQIWDAISRFFVIQCLQSDMLLFLAEDGNLRLQLRNPLLFRVIVSSECSRHSVIKLNI